MPVLCCILNYLCTDMSQIVRDSSNMAQPIVAVTIQYRLNVFAFGDENSSNLALQDQALALDWVQSHIADFGGDPVSPTPNHDLNQPEAC